MNFNLSNVDQIATLYISLVYLVAILYQRNAIVETVGKSILLNAVNIVNALFLIPSIILLSNIYYFSDELYFAVFLIVNLTLEYFLYKQCMKSIGKDKITQLLIENMIMFKYMIFSLFIITIIFYISW